MIPGPFKIVNKQELSGPAASISWTDLSGIPSGSRHLVLLTNWQNTVAQQTCAIRFNNDTGGNYHHERLRGAGAASSAIRQDSQTSGFVMEAPAGANIFGGGQVIIPHYANTANHKAWLSFGGAGSALSLVTGRWANTAAITRVDLLAVTDNFATGSIGILAVMDETKLVAEVDRGTNGTIVFSAIGGGNEDLVCVGYLRSTRAAPQTNDGVHIIINSDTTAGNYVTQNLYGSNSSTVASTGTQQIGGTSAADAAANIFTPHISLIQQYSQGVNYPHILSFAGHHVGSAGFVWTSTTRRSNIAAITQIEIDAANGDMATGSLASLYYLPSNRIHNTDLGSDTAVVGGAVTSGYDLITGHLYARTDATAASEATNTEINDDVTAGNYKRQRLFGTNSSVTADESAAARVWDEVPSSHADAGANVYGGHVSLLMSPDKTDRHKHVIVASGAPKTTNPLVMLCNSRWANTAAVTKLESTPVNGTNFKGT